MRIQNWVIKKFLIRIFGNWRIVIYRLMLIAGLGVKRIKENFSIYIRVLKILEFLKLMTIISILLKL